MKVFIDGVPTEIREDEFENYNVVVNKSNGYSHDYSAIEKFDRKRHFYSRLCPFRKIMIQYAPIQLTVKEADERVVNSSSVSFS